MDLESIINEELKKSMKEGNKLRLETLRSIRTEILNFKKSGTNEELTESVATKLLNKQAKKRKDAIEMYLSHGRTEQAEKEKSELDIINEFLPKLLSESEVNEKLKAIISKNNFKDAKDFGKAMSIAMKELAGQADGRTIQELTKKLLSND